MFFLFISFPGHHNQFLHDVLVRKKGKKEERERENYQISNSLQFIKYVNKSSLSIDLGITEDCSHEIKRHLLLGRKVMTHLDSILKSRNITLSTKVHLVKALVFPVVMYGCDSWTIKEAECRRTDAFELWCWKRLLRVPWTARRSNQFILKEIRPGFSLEGLMLKLKLQYFGHLMRKDPDAGKD